MPFRSSRVTFSVDCVLLNCELSTPGNCTALAGDGKLL